MIRKYSEWSLAKSCLPEATAEFEAVAAAPLPDPPPALFLGPSVLCVRS